MGRSRWSLPMMVVGLVVASAGCTHKVKDYCDQDTPCPDPERPFCDLEGTYPASDYVANTCIADPNLDGGVIDAGVIDAAADATPDTDAALPASLAITPDDDDFGPVTEGNQSSPITFTVSNPGGQPTGVLSVSLSNSDDFAIVTDECDGNALAAAASCAIAVRFQPQAAGVENATLDVDATPGGTAQATLSGTGLALGDLSITPTPWNFGSVAVGSTSPAQHFVVENTGGTSTGTISTTLVDATNYNLTDGCTGTSLAGGAQCSIDITFEPVVAGGHNTSLTVSASPGGDAVASLGATGTAQLIVQKNGTGTVTSTPAGISCGSTCSATFSSSPVNLQATPGTNTTFTGWSLGSCPGTGPCSVVMDGNKSVTASFVTNQLAITGVSHREGDYGSTIFAFQVTLSPASSQTVTVNYATANGTATTGDQDYLAASGTKTFTPGDTSETIEVTVLGDKRNEADETFVVNLSSPSHAVIASGQATGTIEDDDRGFDLNDDGFADIVVGAVSADAGGGELSGAAYVFYGSASLADLSVGDADVVVIGETASDQLGVAVATGDVNGDGRDDLLVSAPRYETAQPQSGEVYIFYGPLAASVDASAADIRIRGDAAGDNFGTSLATGDVNGDGLADILVGANLDDDGGNNSGCAFVFYGSASWSGNMYAADADLKLVGESASNQFGATIANAGDFNGDGLEDIVVGASYRNSQAGTAYIFFGESSWSGTTIDASAADVTFAGAAPFDVVGCSVGGDVDVNGDGKDDVVVGAYGVLNTSGSVDGAAYILFGAAYASPQSLSPSDADYTFLGASNDRMGASVDGIGDINRDGYGDVVIGESYDGDTGESTDAGRVHIILGSASLGGVHTEGSGDTISIEGGVANGYFGSCTSTGFDVNRDGYSDFAVSGPYAGPSQEGRVYLFLSEIPPAIPANAVNATSILTGLVDEGFGYSLQ